MNFFRLAASRLERLVVCRFIKIIFVQTTSLLVFMVPDVTVNINLSSLWSCPSLISAHSRQTAMFCATLDVNVNSMNHTAGWMSCMSNKRDFHIIMVKMLNDLSAEDNVLCSGSPAPPSKRGLEFGGGWRGVVDEGGITGRGSCAGWQRPRGSFSSAQRGACPPLCPLIERATQGLAGRRSSPQALAMSSQSASDSASEEQEGSWTEAGRRLDGGHQVQCDMDTNHLFIHLSMLFYTPHENALRLSSYYSLHRCLLW